MPFTPTPWHTIGPFFPRSFFREGDNDLARAAARGDRILLRGQVLEEGGRPCVNAVLEAWQADAAGRFAHALDPAASETDSGFLGWGRAWTDAQGRYSFRTLRPGSYGDAAGQRAPHVNLLLIGSGIMGRLLTTVFLPGEAANAQDPVLLALPPALRHRLVAAPDGMEDNIPAFRFDLLLHGPPEVETPFFED
ncbi:MAG TPA: protocatechuate 3,4-dioxygenase subunit alpha [Falsiroseomonas sp.]|jgi:protocatechuate 3,4-dioxygenase alpha subunit|nr:protocatechuate 3,4-dioxygenase subunit alpha [Falsiroseomonas sp.]